MPGFVCGKRLRKLFSLLVVVSCARGSRRDPSSHIYLLLFIFLFNVRDFNKIAVRTISINGRDGDMTSLNPWTIFSSLVTCYQRIITRKLSGRATLTQ